MTDAIHKIVMFIVSPLTVGIGLLASGLVLSAWRRRHGLSIGPWSAIPVVMSFVWLCLWSMPLMTRLIGLPLERDYPPLFAEEQPAADAIVLLGGGMDVDTNACPYAEMMSGADRVWHAARLYKAGKSARITLSGGRVHESTVPLLSDFGVPEDALSYFEEAKNTEDEARMIAADFSERNVEDPKVLLVTSAWHMRRARWLFERAGVRTVPAATDYETTIRYGAKPIAITDILPDAASLFQNSYLFKEHFAYWCYRLLK